jgi:putative FmdB family regulatory protein
MPIYEYECESCRKVHEVMQKFSDAPLTACPECNSPVKKLVSMSSFALKGTGWYTTDYKKKPAVKTDAKPESKTPAEAGKPEAKADSKPAQPAVESKPKSASTT